MIGDHGRAARKTKRPGDERREQPSRNYSTTGSGLLRLAKREHCLSVQPFRARVRLVCLVRGISVVEPLGRLRNPAEMGQEKLLFNFFLDSPKPLFRAGCPFSPVLNLSLHLVRSVFGSSELHGKLVCKTHSAIAVFFCQVGRRSNFRNDGLSRVIYLRDFSLRLFFGHKFEHLFGCIIGMLIHD
jgi:hypothetical protein